MVLLVPTLGLKKNVTVASNALSKTRQIHQQNIAKCIKNMYFNKK
jgi:hypothetical protein